LRAKRGTLLGFHHLQQHFPHQVLTLTQIAFLLRQKCDQMRFFEMQIYTQNNVNVLGAIYLDYWIKGDPSNIN
jgi:hypothetical protein